MSCSRLARTCVRGTKVMPWVWKRSLPAPLSATGSHPTPRAPHSSGSRSRQVRRTSAPGRTLRRRQRRGRRWSLLRFERRDDPHRKPAALRCGQRDRPGRRQLGLGRDRRRSQGRPRRWRTGGRAVALGMVAARARRASIERAGARIGVGRAGLGADDRNRKRAHDRTVDSVGLGVRASSSAGAPASTPRPTG